MHSPKCCTFSRLAAPFFLMGTSFLGVMGCGSSVVSTGTNSLGLEDNPTQDKPGFVLGQALVTTRATAAGAEGMNNPTSVHSDGTRLVVADFGNNRVLIWNSIPTYTGQPADLVLGQTNFAGTSANRGTTVGQNTLNGPNSVFIYQSKLLVRDALNHRVLVWNTFPTTNNQNASVVIGQANFTAGSANRGGSAAANTLSLDFNAASRQGAGLSVDDQGRLYIADTANRRVLYYSSIPTSDGASANFVIGQTSLTATVDNGITQTSVKYPISVSSYGGKTAVGDYGVNRIMIFNTPVTNNPGAVAVLGQPDYTSTVANACDEVSTAFSYGVFLKGQNLYVSSTGNLRLLKWNNVNALTNRQAADSVYAQPDFITCTGYRTEKGGGELYGVYVDDNGYSWVAEAGNHRVVVNKM